MSRSTGESARGTWRRDLAPTADCVPLDRIGDALDPRERAHVQTCARCQAELELWRAFERDEPLTTPHDEAAVHRIAARAHHHVMSIPVAGATSTRRPASWFAVAAAVVLAVAAAVLLRDASPEIGLLPTESGASRSGTIEVERPVGDVQDVPHEFVWAPIRGATHYELRLMEVDRNVLWSASTESSRLTAHPDLTSWAVPMKTLLWEVIARDARGGVLARSEPARFRVISSP
jgi:hypothetical protein